MDLDLARVFVKVVQNGSFSRAATQLRVPKSNVSKSVARLEKLTGTQLLLRTTRSLTLTAAGRAFYDSCLGPIQTLEDAMKSLDGKDTLLQGVVRLTASEDLGSQIVAPALGELTRKYPHLNFDLNYTDEIIDLVKDGYDLAIRLGRLKESRLKAKKVGEITLILIASSRYLESMPKIRSPRDLEHHDCLSISLYAKQGSWLLKSKKESIQAKINPRIASNQMSSLLRMAVSGAGVALVPNYLCQAELASGEIVRVLPDWCSPGLPVSLISPLASSASARLKLTSDHLFSALQKALSK